MRKRHILFIRALLGLTFWCGSALAARQELDLSGTGWRLWQDSAAPWQNDMLFLPPVKLDEVPVKSPTGGWDQLSPSQGRPVSVPGTAEEYLNDEGKPQRSIRGVTWWFRKVRLPEGERAKRFVLKFESVRQRAEVYINRTLVGYDLVGNSPFEVDITPFTKPGQEIQLAVRVTNPGGNASWEDYYPLDWGRYKLPMSHGFGGMTGRVTLMASDTVYLSDLYIQNTPSPREVNAIVTVNNAASTTVRRDLLVSVAEKTNPAVEVFRREIKAMDIPAGETVTTVPVSAAQTRLWDLEHPELYVCRVSLSESGQVTDAASQVFGFRWFALDGQGGTNAVVRLNGKRVMMRTAISWGFWPINGIYPTPKWAAKQIQTAKDLGLNMLTFHRCIGNPVVMEKADEMGLLYGGEPGGYVSGGKDPFAQALAREKLLRMIKRDRSHPCLVMYNMINEQWNSFGADKDEALFGVHLRDIKAAHTQDPSRLITYTSAWARYEKAKLHMRPFDGTPHYQGWWDDHRAEGPVVWREDFYSNPTNHYGFTRNYGEIVFRGEEGAVSAPPRLGLIKRELEAEPHKGWDGAAYLEWHDAFETFITRKNLTGAFPTVDALCAAMGVMSLEHQGRKIELHRICNANDGYAINGWESQIAENHSGVVDCFRNPKADPAIVARYNQPLYVAVLTRSQVVNTGDPVTVDFHIVNERDAKGPHLLTIKARDTAGQEVFAKEIAVQLSGGDVYGELLAEGVSIPTPARAGMCRIEASLVDPHGQEQARGADQVLTVDWKTPAIPGKGALLERDGMIGAFLKAHKQTVVPTFNDTQGALDWIMVTLPLKPSLVVIPADALRAPSSQKNGLSATFFSDVALKQQAGQQLHEKVDFKWTGTPPDVSVGKIENYSVRWEGTLMPPTSGEYELGILSEGGVRLWLDGRQVIDAWKDGKKSKQVRLAMVGGKPVSLLLEYFHARAGAEIHLQWAPPVNLGFDPARLFERVKNEGTTLFIMNAVDTWMELIPKHAAVQFAGSFDVGGLWVGGQYFVREHPLFKDLPVNCGLNWPYQSVVGKPRQALKLEGEELVVGCYNSKPFNLGTSVGVIPCGRGRIVVSTLNIANNLAASTSGRKTDLARKLLCNYLDYASRANRHEDPSQKASSRSLN